MSEKKNTLAIERTFTMIKPDGVERGLIGEILGRFEKRGLKIIALKMVKPSVEHIDNHYPKDDTWIARLGDKGFNCFAEYGLNPKEVMGTDNNLEAGKMVRQWLVDYMIEAPVVAMVIEGIHAIEMVRKITGSTLPNKAEIGTIRGDFSVDSPAAANLNKRSIKNLIHASETKAEAENEIKHWFSEEEIHPDYDRADHAAMF
ncbi:MAG: nucleoside-diphosphate kinase [Candidatus Berkelbacteria bacterium]|nr:nucleoside-diphosphate kinase [Candidatus Berkelbacteria bacterium]